MIFFRQKLKTLIIFLNLILKDFLNPLYSFSKVIKYKYKYVSLVTHLTATMVVEGFPAVYIHSRKMPTETDRFHQLNIYVCNINKNS